jgi:hypothetical protein
MMKRCPSCQRTYEDNAQTFCFVDGMRLVEEGQAYDSQRTLVAPPPPAQTPDPAQYYRPDKQTGPTSPYSTQGNQSPSWPQPGAQSGQQGWPAPPIPAPQQAPGWGTPPPSPYPQSAPYDSKASQDKRRGLGITALVLGLLSIQNAIFIMFRWAFPYSPMRTVTLLLALLGLVLGAIALTLSVTNSTRYAARGHALAGIITSFLSLFIILTRGGAF